jgi:hypothetical protein
MQNIPSISQQKTFGNCFKDFETKNYTGSLSITDFGEMYLHLFVDSDSRHSRFIVFNICEEYKINFEENNVSDMFINSIVSSPHHIIYVVDWNKNNYNTVRLAYRSDIPGHYIKHLSFESNRPNPFSLDDNTNTVIITGGPFSGKSSLLNELKNKARSQKVYNIQHVTPDENTDIYSLFWYMRHRTDIKSEYISIVHNFLPKNVYNEFVHVCCSDKYETDRFISNINKNVLHVLLMVFSLIKLKYVENNVLLLEHPEIRLHPKLHSTLKYYINEVIEHISGSNNFLVIETNIEEFKHGLGKQDENTHVVSFQ